MKLYILQYSDCCEECPQMVIHSVLSDKAKAEAWVKEGNTPPGVYHEMIEVELDKPSLGLNWI